MAVCKNVCAIPSTPASILESLPSITRAIICVLTLTPLLSRLSSLSNANDSFELQHCQIIERLCETWQCSHKSSKNLYNVKSLIKRNPLSMNFSTGHLVEELKALKMSAEYVKNDTYIRKTAGRTFRVVIRTFYLHTHTLWKILFMPFPTIFRKIVETERSIFRLQASCRPETFSTYVYHSLVFSFSYIDIFRRSLNIHTLRVSFFSSSFNFSRALSMTEDAAWIIFSSLSDWHPLGILFFHISQAGSFCLYVCAYRGAYIYICIYISYNPRVEFRTVVLTLERYTLR